MLITKSTSSRSTTNLVPKNDTNTKLLLRREHNTNTYQAARQTITDFILLHEMSIIGVHLSRGGEGHFLIVAPPTFVTVFAVSILEVLADFILHFGELFCNLNFL